MIHLDYSWKYLLNKVVLDNTCSVIKVQNVITRLDQLTIQSTKTRPPTWPLNSLRDLTVTSRMSVDFCSFYLASLCWRIAKLKVNKQIGKRSKTRIGCEQIVVLRIRIGVQYCERDCSKHNCRFLLSVTDPKPFNWLFCPLFWTNEFGKKCHKYGWQDRF